MSVILVAHLIQDIAVLAPLVRHARRCGYDDVRILAAQRLMATDAGKARLRALSGDRPVVPFANTAEALMALNHLSGLVVFASESRSEHHRPCAHLAAALPSRFVSATLQHGYECLGFLHNRAHDAARADAGSNADILCAWFGLDRCVSVPPSDTAKVMTTGATLFLDAAPAAWLSGILDGTAAAKRGCDGPLLVCENLQSVRLAGAPREAFLAALEAFAAVRPVTMRPHPAGAYAKGEVEPPKGVTLDARPLEEAALERYGAAISPPSTILFDLMMRNVPVAVWRDADGLVDFANYRGLPTVTTAEDWAAFAEAAGAPDALAAQQNFVRGLGFPADARARFQALLAFSMDL
ncbi:MAG: hypothetical protein ROR55_18010 [Devosia sp.]